MAANFQPLSETKFEFAGFEGTMDGKPVHLSLTYLRRLSIPYYAFSMLYSNTAGGFTIKGSSSTTVSLDMDSASRACASVSSAKA